MSTNNNNCVGCGCGPSIPQPCVPTPPVCPDPQPCTEVLDAFCVKYTGPALTCYDVTIIPQNTSLALALDALVDAICDGGCCTTPVTATIQNPDYILLCVDETATCPYNGLLYNWSAINLGTSGTGRATGGIVNIDPLANPINTWRVPNDADWYALALALDATATETPFNNVAGGPLKSTTCWSLPNSAATNLSGLNINPSVYRNPSGTFSTNNGQIGLYWSTTRTLIPTPTSTAYTLVYNDDSLFKSQLDKNHGLRIRLVRPIDCSEMAGDYIPNAYIDNAGNYYNAKVIGTLVWITEDLRDTKFNNGTNIPITASDAGWAASTIDGLCCYPDNKANYENIYTIGCEQKKISFEDFTDAIPTSTAKNVEVVRNWGTCVTKQEIDADNTVFSVAIEDSGWQNLEGFDSYYTEEMATRKPQVRRVGTVLHFRGDLIIPLGVSEVIIPVTSPFDLYSKIKRRTPYETVGSDVGVYVDYDKKIWFNNKGSGPLSVIPTTVLPANINLDNTYRCSNVIGTRKIALTEEDTQPPQLLKAKANAPGGKTSTVLLSTYVNIEITTDKKLRIIPLQTLELTDGDTSPMPGNSVLRALTSNFYNQAYMLGAAQMDAGLNNYSTEISTTYPILYDDGTGTPLVPGTYVVVGGDPTDGNWSNISDNAPYSNFTSIVTYYGTGVPTVWGSVELIDIRAYQRRPLLNGNKVWPPFLDAYDFFDTAKAEFLGGFVFNLDNFQAFTSIDNCYANFDGENSCENTPLPAEPGCCESPFVYFMNSTYQSYLNYQNEVANPVSFVSYLADTLGTGVILSGYKTTCCTDCEDKPYYLGTADSYLNLVEGLPNTHPLNPDNLTNCCKQLQADNVSTQTFEEGLPGFLNPCPASDNETCYNTLTTLFDPGFVEDLEKAGILEINTIKGKTILCDLVEFLQANITNVVDPESGLSTYASILLALLNSPLIIQCNNSGDLFIGGFRAYDEFIQVPAL